MTAAHAAPFSLTSSEGSGLLVSSVAAETTIEDPLALTQLHLVFENPEARTIEGRFAFTLPEGAAISRFAMKIDGSWQEAEVVEKQRARVTYESFLHERKDPALLEQGAGNEFAVRVFPIGAGAKREFMLTYSETLRSGQPYKLRLRGLPEVGSLDAKVHVNGKVVAGAMSSFEAPKEDLVVDGATWAGKGPVAVRAGSSVVARVRIGGAEVAAEPWTDTIVLLDTSASRALDLADEVAALKALVARLPAGSRLIVVCFDQSVELMHDGLASAFDDAAAARIAGRRALGASDLGLALRWVKGNVAGTTSKRLVVFTDGIATSGTTDALAIGDLVRELAATGVERADAIAIGGLREEAVLQSIAQRSLKKSGVVAPLELGVDAALAKLEKRVLPKAPIAVKGAAWSYPTTVAAQPGDEVLVFARIPVGAQPRITIGSETFEPIARDATKPLVERAVAQARIEELETRSGIPEARRERETTQLSVAHRVVSKYTSLLVLETEEDYKRFKIDRRSKVDILAVEDGKVVVGSHERSVAATKSTKGEDPPVEAAPPPAGRVASADPPAPQPTLRSRHRSRPPSVRMGATSVSGRLPAESIQRVVRLNFGKFRGCYQKGLLRNPLLEGRIATRFTIGRDGSVGSVSVADSTMDDKEVESCVAKAFYGLQFAQPEGGVIVVTYPIVFSNDPDEPVAAPPAPVRPPVVQRSASLASAPSYSPPPKPQRYRGELASVMNALEAGKREEALALALKWRETSPSDVLSFVGLGEAAEATGDLELAARSYGSILELWSYRVDMRRFAGQRLERLGTPAALALASDAYAGAVADRPDHPSSHRLRAMTLLRLGDAKGAFSVLEKALTTEYPDGRFRGVKDVLRGDIGIAAAAWIAKDVTVKADVEKRLAAVGSKLESTPSTRFVLTWETDANDVDLHIHDAKGGHASYSNPKLASGGTLLADVTTGYGPEAFVIPGAAGDLGFPYRIEVQYFSKGPMGFGMGSVQVVVHDGRGGVTFENRPFVLMAEQMTLDLGTLEAPPTTPSSKDPLLDP